MSLDNELIQVPPYEWMESELRISTPSSYSRHAWLYTTQKLRKKLGLKKFTYYKKSHGNN